VKLIKCFETASMPEDLLLYLSDLLEGEDTVVYWVSKQEEWEDDEKAAYDWFIANGAVDGEKVIIERGTWPTL